MRIRTLFSLLLLPPLSSPLLGPLLLKEYLCTFVTTNNDIDLVKSVNSFGWSAGYCQDDSSPLEKNLYFGIYSALWLSHLLYVLSFNPKDWNKVQLETFISGGWVIFHPLCRRYEMDLLNEIKDFPIIFKFCVSESTHRESKENYLRFGYKNERDFYAGKILVLNCEEHPDLGQKDSRNWYPLASRPTCLWVCSNRSEVREVRENIPLL